MQITTVMRNIWTSPNGKWVLSTDDNGFQLSDGTANYLVTHEHGQHFSCSTILPVYVRDSVGEALRKEWGLTKLREILKPGDTAKTILRHCARSGMSRSISLVVAGEDVTYLAAAVRGEHIDKHGGITMGGCGMDMGFALIYDLSRELYGHGYNCIGRSAPDADAYFYCPSNAHTNYRGERGADDYSPTRIHTDGYAINHRWL